jgi:hypothetical protein
VTNNNRNLHWKASDSQECEFKINLIPKIDEEPLSVQYVISPNRGGPQPKKGEKCSWYKIIGGESKVIYSKLVDIELADQYLKENVVGKTSHSDWVHIALATFNHADILVS